MFKRDAQLVGFVRCYLPARVVEARSRAIPEYRHWSRDGVLTLTDGDMTDFAQIETDLRALVSPVPRPRPRVRSVRLGAHHVEPVQQRAAGAGRTEESEDIHGRGARAGSAGAGGIVPARREFLSGLAGSNCVVNRRYEDSLMPTKVHAESPRKIDAIDALLLAISGHLRQASVPEPTYQVFVVG